MKARKGIGKDLSSFHERGNRLFEDVLSHSGLVCNEAVSWYPRVDVYEMEEGFVVKAELPGITDRDLEIKVEDNILVLKGYRMLYSEATKRTGLYHRLECSCGFFQRSFLLPDTVDKERIKATIKDGVLTLVLPKKEVRVTQISIE
ncbi:MAG TPA: Hsp20/alpha crystallin family protein [Nitrospirae bacterium]|nr:Hsp20/alpha crystallin family protein [Nitrospirota bacterium]